ncbi:MAG TPA: ribosome small subunit-dependent GTPase A [Gammaproteobacteria bacterium]|nr:ribosome small subunit-dependent GTPase A [Gammaproteobacteria bacterium]
MTKRRLTRQQLGRQQKIQTSRISRAQNQAQGAEDLFSNTQLGPEEEGLLIAHYGANLVVENQKTGNLYHCRLRQNMPPLVTGDRVIWRKAKDEMGVVVALVPRKSELLRYHADNEARPIAANVDLICVVIAKEPPPGAGTLDAYLIAAQKLGIEGAIIFNKCDLLDLWQSEIFEKMRDIYETLDYPWIQVSALTNHGVSHLANYLKDKTSIFVGQSGVGKSSLVEKLIPTAKVRIAQLSEGGRLGRHTTTVS